MSYEEFICAVKEEVVRLVGRDMRVELRATKKNNGKEMMGLILREEHINAAPVIYLEEYYEKYQMGIGVIELVKEILEVHESIRCKQSWDVGHVYKYESARCKLSLKIISFEQNQELLQDVPYVPFLDLAIVFYLLIDVWESGTSMMLVRNDTLQSWGITKEQLYQDALENAPKILPPSFLGINVVVDELLNANNNIDLEVVQEENCPKERMFVLSNKEKCLGAAGILYPGQLEEIALALGEDFYILPSSIHEVIILPVSQSVSKEELNAMITEINDTQVEEEEVLSNHAYYYSCETGEIFD